jgi:hypothetical protein
MRGAPRELHCEASLLWRSVRCWRIGDSIQGLVAGQMWLLMLKCDYFYVLFLEMHVGGLVLAQTYATRL